MNSIKLMIASVLTALAMQANAGVTVIDAWVRGVVPGQTDTGAFMTIRSSEATTLTAAKSAVAKSVDIHQMGVDNGMMQMRPVDSIAIASGGVLELKPGAYHFMLLGLTRLLVKGERVPITLIFRDTTGKSFTTDVQAEVRDLTATNASGKGM
jgi:copper(I)-binding protein